MKEEYKVKSLAKAMKVLECFSNDQPELGITEIAEMVKLQKSTVHNIVSTFRELGYLSCNKDNSKYYLGVKLLQFSYIINNHLGFRNFFLPYMRQIADELKEVVYLGIPNEGDVLYIETQFPHGSVAVRNILGERAPMYCTGLGKAMLAYLPVSEQEKYASRKLKKFTENTITTKEALLRDLEQVRLRGYSIDNMEHEYGITCIGVPVFGHDKQVVAALSISAPSLRFDDATVAKNAKRMKEILEPAQYIL